MELKKKGKYEGMLNKIAIIYTTFLRDELMKKTIESIVCNWQDKYVLLIGDQNGKDTNISKDVFHNSWKLTNGSIKRYSLPYDGGLSYARNYLVNRAYEMGIKYCLVTADSIKFTNKYDFTPYIKMLESDPKIAKIGFGIKNRQNFTYDLEIHPEYNKFIVIKPRRSTILRDNIEYVPCDLCCNFFIAKTAVLKEIPYDNNLGLCEHEDHCYRLKQAGYKTFWTNTIEAEYLDIKPEEYNNMRKRLYFEFKEKLKKKYNFNPEGSWLIYNHKLPKDKQL